MSSVPDDGREEEESPGLPGKRPQGLKGTLLDGKQSGNIEPSKRAHQRSSLGYRLARQVPIPVARMMVTDVRQTAAGHPWLDSITLRSQAQDCWGPGSQTAAPERCPDVSNPNPLCSVKTRHPWCKTRSLAPTCHVWTERIGHPAQGTRPHPSGPRLPGATAAPEQGRPMPLSGSLLEASSWRVHHQAPEQGALGFLCTRITRVRGL